MTNDEPICSAYKEVHKISDTRDTTKVKRRLKLQNQIVVVFAKKKGAGTVVYTFSTHYIFSIDQKVLLGWRNIALVVSQTVLS